MIGLVSVYRLLGQPLVDKKTLEPQYRLILYRVAGVALALFRFAMIRQPTHPIAIAQAVLVGAVALANYLFYELLRADDEVCRLALHQFFNRRTAVSFLAAQKVLSRNSLFRQLIERAREEPAVLNLPIQDETLLDVVENFEDYILLVESHVEATPAHILRLVERMSYRQERYQNIEPLFQLRWLLQRRPNFFDPSLFTSEQQFKLFIKGDPSSVSQWVELGFDVDVKWEGNTPLLWVLSSMKREFNSVRYKDLKDLAIALLKNGAHPYSKNRTGQRPSDLCLFEDRSLHDLIVQYENEWSCCEND